MKPGLKKAIKIPCIILGVILILLIIVNFIAGPIAKSYINNHCKELCGRTVTVEKIRTNLFVGKVKIMGLKMLELNDKDEFCSFDTLIVKINPFKLISNEVKLNEITLINPKAVIIQDGDALNFDSLIDFYASDEEEPEEEDSTNWIINLNDITLKGGEVDYRDVAIGSQFDMGNLQLEIPHIYFSGENTDVGINLDFAEGGRLGLQVAYGMENGKYDLDIDLEDFSLAPVFPYLKESMNVSSFDGKLTSKISVKGSTEHIMNIIASGDVEINDIVLKDLEENDDITANKIKVGIDKIDTEKNLFAFNEILIDGIKTEYIIYDTLHDNIDKLLIEDSADEEEDKSESGDGDMNLTIKKFTLDNSSIVYTDNSLLEKFVLPITNINVSANNLNLVSQFDAKLKAQVGDKGELKGSFDGSLSNFSNMKLNIFLKNIKLKDMSPYCVHYTAYPISDGILSLSSISTITNNYLNSSNELNILNCTIEKKRKDVKAEYGNIPLKAGLYILSDRNKKISIDLPVTGNIDDPSFKIGKIIWKTFCNLMVKIATSPFDAFKKEGGVDNFRDMYMDITDRSLTVENYQQLNKLSEELKDIISSKPDVKMSITQSLDKTANLNQIALFRLKLDYFLEANDKNREDLTVEEYKAIQAIKDKDPRLIEYAKNRANVRNTTEAAMKLYSNSEIEGMYKMMNSMREKNLREYFIGQGIPADKLTFLATDEASPDKNRITIKFGMDLPDNVNDIELEAE
ncbi:MAG: DUF748 domain-containing protein [Bacteroidales bacterium]|nr:DUF748 domain-containing protein [Bacteroidales bacterium]